ncbi:MAG: hypothetical protein KGQ49_01015 [Verrucomicrobia bacterium]|nr:hypothetical protein [Verrucomicrobiota bacterium]
MASITDIDLDDELWKARSVQGAYSGFPPPSLPPPSVPLGLSPVSSIAEKPRESPALAAPKQNIFVRLLETQTKAEELASVQLQQFQADTARSRAEIERLEHEKEEAYRKEIEAVKTRDTWGTLSSVAAYVGSAAAIVGGLSMGGVPGILLGAAGVLGGGVKLMNDTHLMRPILEWWTKSHELQKEIQQNINDYAFYLQMGLGVAGGLAAWQAGYFAAMQAGVMDYVTKTATAISYASTAVKAGADVGKAVYNKQIADYMAEGRKLDNAMSQQRWAMNRSTREIQQTLEDLESQGDALRKRINQYG